MKEPKSRKPAFPSATSLAAAERFFGIPRDPAKSFVVPQGKKPIAPVKPMRRAPVTTSFKVPSPPQATITSYSLPEYTTARVASD